MVSSSRALCLLLGLAAYSLAFVGDPVVADPVGDFFKSLRQPGTGNSCCDISDCSFTSARFADGQWLAASRQGDWLIVPNDRILDRIPIDERAILCANSTGVLCFVPPLQGS